MGAAVDPNCRVSDNGGLRAKRLGVADVLLAKRLSVRRMTRQLSRLLSSQQVARSCGLIEGKDTAAVPGPDFVRALDRLRALLS